MTYDNLTAEISLLRTGNDDVLSVAAYDDASLLLLNKVAAKLEMQLDLQAALQIETDDTTTLDEVADAFETRLQRALSYKQLALFYQRHDAGADSKNRLRWDLYNRLYNQEKALFSGLTADAPSASVSSTIFYR